MAAAIYLFAHEFPYSAWLYPSQQDPRLNHSSKRPRPRYSTHESSQAVILHRSVPHKARSHRQLVPAHPRVLKGIIKMPSRNDPETPKKKVRFADEAKTESDRVWLGKTPSKKTSDYKKPPSPRKRHSANPVLVAAGLSTLAAGVKAASKTPHRSSRPRTPRRRDRVETPRTPQRAPRTPRTPTKRREERPREEREAKRPRVVYGDSKVLRDSEWAVVRRRYTYYWA